MSGAGTRKGKMQRSGKLPYRHPAQGVRTLRQAGGATFWTGDMGPGRAEQGAGSAPGRCWRAARAVATKPDGTENSTERRGQGLTGCGEGQASAIGHQREWARGRRCDGADTAARITTTGPGITLQRGISGGIRHRPRTIRYRFQTGEKLERAMRFELTTLTLAR